MGAKPQVLEVLHPSALSGRELKGRVRPGCWQPLDPPGLPVGTGSYHGHCTGLSQEALTLEKC